MVGLEDTQFVPEEKEAFDLQIQSILFIVFILAGILNFVSCSKPQATEEGREGANNLHRNAIHLDAQILAEQGINTVYKNAVMKVLKKYIAHPSTIHELVDGSTGEYVVACDDKAYRIFYDDVKGRHGMDWINATFALFDIVNRQLESTEYRFYALKSEKDLHGVFLSRAEFEEFIKEEKEKKKWPYIPTLKPPWYGKNHGLDKSDRP